MTEIWLTSDQHWGHARILQHCHRPFDSAEEMDEEMIARWNARVRQRDTVYHLGDFAWNNKALEYRRRLNGTIHLIIGNHDKTIKDGFLVMRDIAEIDVDGQKIVLCHYPLQEWPSYFRGAWHLHGHTHGTVKNIERRLDVGVDSWRFAPVSFEEIREAIRG